MKILWFANSQSLYDQGKHFYHGCGWIESLEELLREENVIELAVSFFHPTDTGKKHHKKTTYYPILRKNGRKRPFDAFVNNWKGNIEVPNIAKEMLKIVDDFKPDIIHVFGTEGVFASIQCYTKIPVIIHLQGLINPCLNTYFPPNQSKWDFIFRRDYFFNNLKGNSPFFAVKRMNNQALREKKSLRRANFVMGRTHWDKLIAGMYAPDVIYFHINEVLRPGFYTAEPHSQKLGNPVRIVSTLSPTTYKGSDVVLKTANLLKELTCIDFSWKIIGLSASDSLLRHYEKSLKMNHQRLNIQCVGRKTTEELIEILKESNLFVHPSYIDNSPNSVCEAQMLGLPVIACHVGGISSLIEHNVSGILLPSNGVFELAATIKKFSQSQDQYHQMAIIGKKIAQKRHDKATIVKSIIKAYAQIISS